MAQVKDTIHQWDTVAVNNSPSGSDQIGTGLDDNLREIQKVVKEQFSTGTISAAVITHLSGVNNRQVIVTGTGITITSFGTLEAGAYKIVTFDGANTITHNATSMIMPNGEDFATNAGDALIMYSLGSGNWECINVFRASGVWESPNASNRTRLLDSGDDLDNITDSGVYAFNTSAPVNAPVDHLGGSPAQAVMFVESFSNGYVHQMVWSGYQSGGGIWVRRYTTAWGPWERVILDTSLDNTPVNGATTTPISSDWAYAIANEAFTFAGNKTFTGTAIVDSDGGFGGVKIQTGAVFSTGTGRSGIFFSSEGSGGLIPTDTTGSYVNANGQVTIGTPNYKWKDLYLSGNIYAAAGVFTGNTVKVEGTSPQFIMSETTDTNGDWHITVDSNSWNLRYPNTGTGPYGLTVTQSGGAISAAQLVGKYTGAASAFHPNSDGIYELGTTTLRWERLWTDNVTSTNVMSQAGKNVLDTDHTSATDPHTQYLRNNADDTKTGYLRVSHTTPDIDTLNTTNGSASAWNNSNNSVLFLEGNNNAMVFHISGTLNDRQGNIQVGHDSTTYANTLGTLWLNKFGGQVRVGSGGLRVDGAMDFNSTADFSTTVTVNGTAICNGILDINNAVREKVYNLTGTSINPANGTSQYKTCTGTTPFSYAIDDGESVLLRLVNAHLYTVTFPTTTWTNGNVVPDLSSNCAVVIWRQGSTYYGTYVGSFA